MNVFVISFNINNGIPLLTYSIEVNSRNNFIARGTFSTIYLLNGQQVSADEIQNFLAFGHQVEIIINNEELLQIALNN